MFCNEYSVGQIENRPLKQYEISASKLILELGYNIDFDDEKEDYDFDHEENVVLLDGRKMSWADVKVNGFDWLSLSYIDSKGNVVQFADYELA
ncbi:hypothetical protein [Clostridium lundense]|uniref:hypothetical protein n=1 Tax=Clostridium lundense TaxID=319475 RepID=UPI000687FAF8|nr:hypothetical protein [Clostridium lundense]